MPEKNNYAHLGVCPRSLYGNSVNPDQPQEIAWLVKPYQQNWAKNVLVSPMHPANIRSVARVSHDLPGDRTPEVVSVPSNLQTGDLHTHNGQEYIVVQRMGNPSSMNDVIGALNAGKVFAEEKKHIDNAQAIMREKMLPQQPIDNISAGLAQLDRIQNEIRSKMQS